MEGRNGRLDRSVIDRSCDVVRAVSIFFKSNNECGLLHCPRCSSKASTRCFIEETTALVSRGPLHMGTENNDDESRTVPVITIKLHKTA